MLIKGKDVIGLNVVTIDTGTVIETVKDVAYNPTTQRIEALFVRNGGLFKQAKAIHIDAVHNIGEDAAIVADASVVKSAKDQPKVITSISGSNKYLIQTKVLTIKGKALGKVSDIVFDSQTGIVDSMEVSQGGLKTLTEGKKSIKPSDIVTIGVDTTIVSTYTELKLEAQGEQGGLKGVMNEAKQKVADISEEAKQVTQDLAAHAAETGREIGENAQNTSEKLLKTASEAYEDTNVATRKQLKQAKRNTDEITNKALEIAEDVKENVKDNYGSQVDSLRNTRRKVVSKTQETIEDGKERIEIEKTKVLRSR